MFVGGVLVLVVLHIVDALAVDDVLILVVLHIIYVLLVVDVLHISDVQFIVEGFIWSPSVHRQ